MVAKVVKCTFVCSAQREPDKWSGEVGLIHHGALGVLGSWRLREMVIACPLQRGTASQRQPAGLPSLPQGPQQGREGQGSVQLPDFKFI